MDPNADGTGKQGDALAQGRPRPDGQQPSAKTYSQEEHDQLMSERHRGLNKTIDALTKERDTLKSSHESLATQFKELQGRLDAEDEARLRDDPAGLDTFQQRKKMREEKAVFTQEKQAFEAEKATWAERIRAVEDEEFNLAVFEVAEEAKGDATRLRDMARKYGVAGKDKLKELASDLWPKPPKNIPPVDSGGSDGGGKDWSKATPEEKIEEGLRRERHGK